MSDKFIDVYPDKDGAKEFIKSVISILFKENLNLLENETGKAPASCPMPESTTNPSKYSSVLVAILNALLTLQDK